MTHPHCAIRLPPLTYGRADLTNLVRPCLAPHKPYIAFRYATPLTVDCLDEMKADGVERAVAFTQYPQYSCSTTGSSINELYRHLVKDKAAASIQWSVIDRWPTHPTLVEVSSCMAGQSFSIVCSSLLLFSPTL